MTRKDRNTTLGLKTHNFHGREISRPNETEAELIFTALADPGLNPGEHAADRRDRASRGHAEEQSGRKKRWWHRQEGAAGIGAAHGKGGGVVEQFPAAEEESPS